ncbi:E3 ubiquitin-protein ligase NRDP1 [Halotydeus destructor]|nr:E3 ubiquitin-protein ligase NRDP1 [Halotydeus destructor]
MGHDLNYFVSEIPSCALCPLCNKVLEDPVQLDCIKSKDINHIVCRECPSDKFAAYGSRRCPIDGERFSKRNTQRSLLQDPPQAITSTLSKLLIKCDRSNCSTLIRLNRIKAHISSCKFALNKEPKFSPTVKASMDLETKPKTETQVELNNNTLDAKEIHSSTENYTDLDKKGFLEKVVHIERNFDDMIESFRSLLERKLSEISKDRFESIQALYQQEINRLRAVHNKQLLAVTSKFKSEMKNMKTKWLGRDANVMYVSEIEEKDEELKPVNLVDEQQHVKEFAIDIDLMPLMNSIQAELSEQLKNLIADSHIQVNKYIVDEVTKAVALQNALHLKEKHDLKRKISNIDRIISARKQARKVHNQQMKLVFKKISALEKKVLHNGRKKKVIRSEVPKLKENAIPCTEEIPVESHQLEEAGHEIVVTTNVPAVECEPEAANAPECDGAEVFPKSECCSPSQSYRELIPVTPEIVLPKLEINQDENNHDAVSSEMKKLREAIRKQLDMKPELTDKAKNRKRTLSLSSASAEKTEPKPRSRSQSLTFSFQTFSARLVKDEAINSLGSDNMETSLNKVKEFSTLEVQEAVSSIPGSSDNELAQDDAEEPAITSRSNVEEVEPENDDSDELGLEESNSPVAVSENHGRPRLLDSKKPKCDVSVDDDTDGREMTSNASNKTDSYVEQYTASAAIADYETETISEVRALESMVKTLTSRTEPSRPTSTRPTSDQESSDGGDILRAAIAAMNESDALNFGNLDDYVPEAKKSKYDTSGGEAIQAVSSYGRRLSDISDSTPDGTSFTELSSDSSLPFRKRGRVGRRTIDEDDQPNLLTIGSTPLFENQPKPIVPTDVYMEKAIPATLGLTSQHSLSGERMITKTVNQNIMRGTPASYALNNPFLASNNNTYSAQKYSQQAYSHSQRQRSLYMNESRLWNPPVSLPRPSGYYYPTAVNYAALTHTREQAVTGSQNIVQRVDSSSTTGYSYERLPVTRESHYNPPTVPMAAPQTQTYPTSGAQHHQQQQWSDFSGHNQNYY